MVDFAIRETRKRVYYLNACGNCVPWQAQSQVFSHFSLRSAGKNKQDDFRACTAFPAGCRSISNAVQPKRRRLNIIEFDSIAADLHLTIHPPHKCECPLLLNEYDIARSIHSSARVLTEWVRQETSSRF